MQVSLIKVTTSICKNAFLYFPASPTGTSHAFTIDFRCFCSCSQIYEERNLKDRQFDLYENLFKILCITCKRVILHIHQQEKLNLLNRGHENMIRTLHRNLFERRTTTNSREGRRILLKYQKENLKKWDGPPSSLYVLLLASSPLVFLMFNTFVIYHPTISCLFLLS